MQQEMELRQGELTQAQETIRKLEEQLRETQTAKEELMEQQSQLQEMMKRLEESLQKGEVERIHLVPGQDMIANCLTKKGASSQRLRGLLKEGFSP